jgi:branched-chain amino acid transport system permease protein
MGRGNLIALGVLAILIVAFPLIDTSPYHLRVMNFAGIFCLVSIGLSLLMGYAGQISIGQAGFFAIGAYCSGILTAQFGFSVWSGILFGIALNCIVASLVGVPTLKLRGHYLAMATLGIGEIIHVIARADTEDFTKLIRWVGEMLGYSPQALAKAMEPYRAMTGGPSGLANIPTLGIGPWHVDTGTEWFYTIWFLVLLAMIFSLNLVHSRIGRALRAIHGNEEAAQAVGLNTAPLKLKVFVMSAVLASIAGSMYAHYQTFIAPGPFSINQSIFFVVWVAVGGMMNVWGALVGTLIMRILPETLRMFHDFDILFNGFTLLIIAMFIPNGIVGLVQNLFRSAGREKAG